MIVATAVATTYIVVSAMVVAVANTIAVTSASAVAIMAFITAASYVVVIAASYVVVTAASYIVMTAMAVSIANTIAITSTTVVVITSVVANATTAPHTAMMVHGMTIHTTEASVPMRTTRDIISAMVIKATMSSVIAVIDCRETIVVIACVVVTIDGEEPSIVKPC